MRSPSEQRLTDYVGIGERPGFNMPQALPQHGAGKNQQHRSFVLDREFGKLVGSSLRFNGMIIKHFSHLSFRVIESAQSLVATSVQRASGSPRNRWASGVFGGNIRGMKTQPIKPKGEEPKRGNISIAPPGKYTVEVKSVSIFGVRFDRDGTITLPPNAKIKIGDSPA